MAEEYVDANHWKQSGLPFRLTKAVERRALAAADGVVTLTERIWPILQNWEGLRGRKIVHEVIPCCADLELFNYSAEERKKRREELRLGNRWTVVYCGSIDGWYLTEEMADFFVQVLRKKPDAHLLWLTPVKHDRIEALMMDRAISREHYTIKSVAPQEVPSYLSACDVGLAFIRASFSKLASSPTKNAEYLGCGLPLVINAGVGDSDTLINDWNVGALVENLSEADYSRAVATIDALTVSEMIRTQARSVAEKLFDLRKIGTERYVRLYLSLLRDPINDQL
jgi:glycosyltransferase involved in cell wall biosynthesis